MTDQSISSHLRTIFELALRDYEIKTQMSLANHPLAQKIDSHSVESITILLQVQVVTFGEFRGRDRVMKSIRNIVTFLYKLEATAALVDGISLVCQKTLITVFRVPDIVLQLSSPVKALYTGLGVLLAVCVSPDSQWRIRSETRVQAAKDVVDSYDALVDLLETTEHFLKLLDIYTEVPPTSALDELAVNIMAEVLSTLALATKELKQGRSSESILTHILRNSAQRRGIRTRTFWKRQAYRSSPDEARSAHPRRDPNDCRGDS
jgi:hypothetical protein